MINTTLKIDFKKRSLSSFFLLSVFVICVLVFTTCDIDAASRSRDNVNIYSVGFYTGTENEFKACYWKNGERADLPSPPDAVNSLAVSITGYGSDIYITGYYDYDIAYIYNDNFVGSIYFTKNIPCYWKNGIRADLPIPADANYTHTGALYVSGGVVIVFGVYYTDSGEKWCHWINGERTDFNINDYGTSILDNYIIDKSDNFSTRRIEQSFAIGSYRDDSSNKKLCYWKDGINGNRIDLPLPSGVVDYGVLSCFYTSDGGFYVTGYYSFSSDQNRSRSCYWKNGVYTALPIPAGAIDSYVNAIYAYGGNAYVAGRYTDSNYNEHICYWKNTTFTELGVIDDGSLVYGRINDTLIEVKK